METSDQNQPQPQPQPVLPLLPLPNSTGVLVLGILSIVGCWCIGIVGLINGIIALVLAKKAGQLYIDNPGKYSESSYKNMQGGKICAIIGTCISSVYVLFYLVYLLVVGAALFNVPWNDFFNV
jgi:hypothetical protein